MDKLARIRALIEKCTGAAEATQLVKKEFNCSKEKARRFAVAVYKSLDKPVTQ